MVLPVLRLTAICSSSVCDRYHAGMCDSPPHLFCALLPFIFNLFFPCSLKLLLTARPVSRAWFQQLSSTCLSYSQVNTEPWCAQVS